MKYQNNQFMVALFSHIVKGIFVKNYQRMTIQYRSKIGDHYVVMGLNILNAYRKILIKNLFDRVRAFFW